MHVFLFSLFLVACGGSPAPGPIATVPPTANPDSDSDSDSDSDTAPAERHEMAAPDVAIVPGERFGPLTAAMTRDEVVELFSGATLIDTSVPLGEGHHAPGLDVAFDTGAALEIVWADAGGTGIAEVRAKSPLWRTAEGLHVGMTLDQLTEVLGPFDVHGFGWDHGGTIRLKGTRAEAHVRNLFLVLSPAEGAESEALSRVRGDRLYPADHPDLVALTPTVTMMRVVLR